jgi:hypothetical protein
MLHVVFKERLAGLIAIACALRQTSCAELLVPSTKPY